jgi:hypothetical protein
MRTPEKEPARRRHRRRPNGVQVEGYAFGRAGQQGRQDSNLQPPVLRSETVGPVMRRPARLGRSRSASVRKCANVGTKSGTKFLGRPTSALPPSAVGAIVAVLSVFAPSGLGVREASMFGLLLAVVSEAVALGATVLNRLAITVVEALLLVVYGLAWRRRRRDAAVGTVSAADSSASV